MGNIISMTTPVGRLVQGDAFIGQSTDMDGNQLVWKSGENAGQARFNYYAGVAIPKSEQSNFLVDWEGSDTPAQQADLWQALNYIGAIGSPNLFQNGQCVKPDFAFKVLDGDDPKHANSEGFAGCWVIKFSTAFAPRVVDNDAHCSPLTAENGKPKRGDYVRVFCRIKGNGDTRKPGLYIHQELIQFAAHGTPISSGANATNAFGSPMGSLPSGASQTPVAGAPMPSAAGGAPAPAPAAPGAPAPAPAAPGASGSVEAPNSVPAPAPAPVWVPVPTTKMAADGTTYEALKAAGWTDKQMVEHGYIESDGSPF